MRPAVSFGYFEKYSGIENLHPDRELVRRWTGGGVVLHGEDFTYSLIIPNECPLIKMKPAESYLAIHESLTQAMLGAGMAASLTAGASQKISTACFENAVRHDVLAGGRKIAGAAQRRTRNGLLHQGSIQSAELPGNFGEQFAGKLASRVIPRQMKQSELSAAVMLAESKYATQQWLQKF
jgi:lipoate-protein ligase A